MHLWFIFLCTFLVRANGFYIDSVLGVLPAESGLRSAVITPQGDVAYVGTGSGWIVRLNLVNFTRTSSVRVSSSGLRAAAISPDGLYAYFATYTSPGVVFKVDLSAFVAVGNITLNAGENLILSAASSRDGRFVFFATDTNPTRLVRIRTDTFSRDASLTFNSGEASPVNIITSPNDDGIYLVCGATIPGGVIRIVGSTMNRTNGMIVPSNGNVFAGALDPAGRFMYVTTLGRLVYKLDMVNFTVNSSIALQSGEDFVSQVVVSLDGTAAYLAADPGCGVGCFEKIVQVTLGNFSRTGVVTFTGAYGAYSSLRSPDGVYAYFGSIGTSLGRLVLDKFASTSTGIISVSSSSSSVATYLSNSLQTNSQTMSITTSHSAATTGFQISSGILTSGQESKSGKKEEWRGLREGFFSQCFNFHIFRGYA